MALEHASSGDVIGVRPFGIRLREHLSSALLRTERFELMRLALPEGKRVREHEATGPLTLQCIEGVVDVVVQGEAKPLCAGELIYIESGTPYALLARQDASLLMSLVRLPN